MLLVSVNGCNYAQSTLPTCFQFYFGKNISEIITFGPEGGLIETSLRLCYRGQFLNRFSRLQKKVCA
jgi:hypothetical protein